jgi:putative nucleotidyltransferase with HDIG domain
VPGWRFHLRKWNKALGKRPDRPSWAVQGVLLAATLVASAVAAAGLPSFAKAWVAVPILAHAGSVAILAWKRRPGGPAHREAFEGQLGIVKAIALAMEARDLYTQGHCLRVRRFTRRLLDVLGEPAPERELIEAAALLHDVGKVGVPDSVLLKKGALDEDERARLMLHVEIGVEILSALPALGAVARVVKHHHERFDGTGYPDGLAGHEIPFGSRVIAVADAVDAMRSTRPYRAALTLEAAIEELRRASGRQLDPRIAAAAVELLQLRRSGRDRDPPVLPRSLEHEARATEVLALAATV